MLGYNHQRSLSPGLQAIFDRHAKAAATLMIALSDAGRAFLLLLITICLSAFLVWALWEMEQSRERRTQRRQRQSRPRLTWKR